MAKRELTPEQLAGVKELAKQWGKIIARRAYGESGPALDVDFDQMEQIAAAASVGLVEGTLEQLTHAPAQNSPTSDPVPPATRCARSEHGPANGSHAGPCSRSKNRSLTAPPVAGTFSPQRTNRKLDAHGYSPSVLAKIVHAGAVLPSFDLAARALRLLADLSISGRHVGRLTERIGAELVSRRDEPAEAHRLGKLEAHVLNAPDVAVVEVDGGGTSAAPRDEGVGRGLRSGARTRWRAWSRSPARPTTPTHNRNRPRASSAANTSRA